MKYPDLSRRPNRFERLSPFARVCLTLAIAALVLIVLFALAEGAVRVRQFVKHGAVGAGIESLYEFDEAVGLRVPIPGYQSDRVTIDGHGFRNPAFPTPKPPGTIRIAFLGASTTFSAEVSSDEATWPHMLVEKLRAAYPAKSFDYINAGVPGYGVSQSLRNLELRVARHDPDVIVIYHATNDLSGNSREVARSRGLDTATEDTRLSWLSRHSQLVYLLEKNYYVWAAQKSASHEDRKLNVPRDAFTEPFRRDLDALVRRAQQIAEEVVLVTFSIRIRAEQGPDERRKAAVTGLYYMPHMTPEGLIEHFGAYNDVIRAVGAETGVLVVGDEHAIPGTAEYFVDTVHFTDSGSALMADRIARAMIESRLFDALPRPAP